MTINHKPEITFLEPELVEAKVDSRVSEMKTKIEKVSQAYEEFKVIELVDEINVDFTEKGKELFIGIDFELKKYLRSTGTEPTDLTMEDWRSIPWKKFFPDLKPGQVNNRVIFFIWKFRFAEI